MKNLGMFINNAKVLFVALTTAVTIGACKTYTNTIVAIYDNNKFVVRDQKNVDRLIICTQETNRNPELPKAVPYFVPGDEVGVYNTKIFKNYNWDNRRVFTVGEDTDIKYNHNEIYKRQQEREKYEILSKSTQTTPIPLDTTLVR